jgi:hypothetical protein
MAAAPQNRAHLAVKRDVIRKHLAQAVRLFSTEEFENFTFFKQLKKEDIEFNAFKFADGLDVNIQLPVSLQVILLIIFEWCKAICTMDFLFSGYWKS